MNPSPGKLYQTPLQRIGGYELLDEIGRGQAATVYLARDAAGRTAAVKVLAEHVAENPRRLVRFYQEARHAMRIDHPNVLQVFEVGEDGGRHFLAMEYVSGQSLAQWLNREGALPEERALEIAVALARGVAAIHKLGIVHRDVGPRNILIGASGEVKLGDLEFSKQLDGGLDLTAQGGGIGTPDYMAPEQFRQAARVDHRADVYALGATLYVMATGRLPFPGKSDVEKLVAKVNNRFTLPREINPRLSSSTAELIRLAMLASPSRRLPTANAFKRLAKLCLARLVASSAPAAAVQPAAALPPAESLWTVLSLTASGQTLRQRLTAGQVAQQVRGRKLGPEARAALGGQRVFAPLSEIPAFCDLFLPRPANQTNWAQGLAAAVRRSLAALGSGLQRLGHTLSQVAVRRTADRRRGRAATFIPPVISGREEPLPLVAGNG